MGLTLISYLFTQVKHPQTQWNYEYEWDQRQTVFKVDFMNVYQ